MNRVCHLRVFLCFFLVGLTTGCTSLVEPIPNYIALSGTWANDAGASLKFYRDGGETLVQKTVGQESWEGTYVCVSDHDPAQLDIDIPGQKIREMAVLIDEKNFVIYENPAGNSRPVDLSQAVAYRFQPQPTHSAIPDTSTE